MKFYLTLTDADGILLDRFRLELPAGENPADDAVGEDSEGVGHRISNSDLAERLARVMRSALAETRTKPTTTPEAPTTTPGDEAAKSLGFRLARQAGWNSRAEAWTYAKDELKRAGVATTPEIKQAFSAGFGPARRRTR